MDEHTILLICRLVDGVASREEEEELHAMAEKDPEVAAELNEQRGAAAMFRSLGLAEPADEVKAQFWGGVYNRLERRAGWLLVIIGFALVIAFSLYELITDPGVHVIWRIGIAALLVGLGLVFSGIARNARRARRADRYSEVIR
jgi:hypothetical protein